MYQLRSDALWPCTGQLPDPHLGSNCQQAGDAKAGQSNKQYSYRLIGTGDVFGAKAVLEAFRRRKGVSFGGWALEAELLYVLRNSGTVPVLTQTITGGNWSAVAPQVQTCTQRGVACGADAGHDTARRGSCGVFFFLWKGLQVCRWCGRVPKLGPGRLAELRRVTLWKSLHTGT